MHLPLAIFLPFLVFFTTNNPLDGVICLLLQITIIGWLAASVWAILELDEYYTDKQIKNISANKIS